ncbi:DUF1659 domain-containing protein [Pectinatus frisingensis]|uniref:DUF1659 domain-containing protein n=1 Tax=Pectinatus frisingensis TaxID=865 RepID=UPI0015F44EBB|nr:DUF1659 domain-containing protein [Pectinatus frisingensis]
MPAIKTDQSTKLIIKVQTGVTESGKAKYSQRSFASINPATADDGLLTVGKSISELQKYPAGVIMRQDVCTLDEA